MCIKQNHGMNQQGSITLVSEFWEGVHWSLWCFSVRTHNEMAKDRNSFVYNLIFHFILPKKWSVRYLEAKRICCCYFSLLLRNEIIPWNKPDNQFLVSIETQNQPNFIVNSHEIKSFHHFESSVVFISYQFVYHELFRRKVISNVQETLYYSWKAHTLWLTQLGG